MSYRYINANDLVDKVDAKTQDFINEMPCMFADVKPLNQHINIDEIRAEERAKVIEEISKEIAFEEKWLFGAIREDKGNYAYNIDIAFSGIKNSLNKLAKRES